MYDLCLTYLTTPTTHITQIVILINCTYIYCSSIINAKTSLFKFLQIWGRYVKVDKLFFFAVIIAPAIPKRPNMVPEKILAVFMINTWKSVGRKPWKRVNVKITWVCSYINVYWRRTLTVGGRISPSMWKLSKFQFFFVVV